MSDANPFPSRQRVLDRSLVIIAKARRAEAAPVLARQEARALLRDNPDCGMSERDICEHLVRLSRDSGLPVDPAR